MELPPRFNFDHRDGYEPSLRMEWLSTRYSDSTLRSSRDLLKAQLLAGQHTLDKEQFVKVAKHYGWILQIPEHLLA